MDLVKPIAFDNGPLTVAAQLKEMDFDVKGAKKKKIFFVFFFFVVLERHHLGECE